MSKELTAEEEKGIIDKVIAKFELTPNNRDWVPLDNKLSKELGYRLANQDVWDILDEIKARDGVGSRKRQKRMA